LCRSVLIAALFRLTYLESMLTLQAKNLSKRFGQRIIFRNISFDNKAGRIIGIAGPNGSGKSTLLKILMGLTMPSSGEIIACDENDRLKASQRMDISAAVTPYFDLYEPLSGLEHLNFFRKLRGLAPEDSQNERWLETFEIAERAKDPVSVYSSGMRQRLKLALAFSLSPRILFLDEPASNLDSTGNEIVLAEAKKASETMMIFWASNTEAEIELADEVVRLA